MKIAVASVDGTSISQHFGQSTGFIVFEAEGETIKSSEWRTAQATPHAAGICQHGSGHEHNHGGGLAMIADCGIVVCGGMGAGAANALKANGLQPVILPVAGPAAEVIARYLKGEIAGTETATCECHH